MKGTLTSSHSGRVLLLAVLLIAVIAAGGLVRVTSAQAVETEEGTATPELQLIMHIHGQYMSGRLDYIVGDRASIRGGVTCRGSDRVLWGRIIQWGRVNKEGYIKVIGKTPTGCTRPQAVVEMLAWGELPAERVEATPTLH